MARPPGPLPTPHPPKFLKGLLFIIYTKLHANDVIKNENTPHAKYKRHNKKIFSKKLLKYQGLTGIKRKKVIYTTQKKT